MPQESLPYDGEAGRSGERTLKGRDLFNEQFGRLEWLRLSGTFAAGLLNVAGSIAIAPLVHSLFREGTRAHVLPLLVVVGLRPLFALLHTSGIYRLLTDLAAQRGRAAPTSLINNVIIATRDGPVVILLLVAMAYFWGWAGVVASVLTASGLIGAAMVRKSGHSKKTGRRMQRAWREFVSELPLTLLVLAAATAQLWHALPRSSTLAGIGVCLLLIRGPLRRVARLMDVRPWLR